jgi:hypothetical protein
MDLMTLTLDAANVQVEAIVPVQGITAGTMVLTLDGELPVQFLAPGDRIVTRSGARTLRDIEVSVISNAKMVRISASALGHDRPAEDLFVAPDQAILIRDWRAKALYGVAQAMVPAARLIDGDYIREEVVAEARVFTLRFDNDAVIYAGGLELSCAAATVAA